MSSPYDPKDKRSVCSNCNKSSEEKLCMCSRCKITKYCNKECQRADWRKHKPICTQYVENIESGNKLLKDSETWMDENNVLLQCFLMHVLRAFGGPEMSLVATHYAVLMGDYDVARRMVQLTDYSVIETSMFTEKFPNFTPPDKHYACLALVVNGTARVRRVPDDPEGNKAVGIVPAALQDERAQSTFNALKAIGIGPKISREKITRSIKKHEPETAAMHQRRKAVMNKHIMHAIDQHGEYLYSSFIVCALRMNNAATTMKDTHRILLRILLDDNNVRIVSCTAEPIENIATYMRSNGSDIEFWRNGDEQAKKNMRESEKPKKFFPGVVRWVVPGDTAVEGEAGGGFLTQPLYLYTEDIAYMECIRQSSCEHDRDLKALIKWANERPGTLPESSVPEEWRAAPANGGGYL